MIEDTCSALHRIVADPGAPPSEWVVPYGDDKEPSAHHFVLFLKPEATAIHAGVDLDKFMTLIAEKLYEWKVSVGAIRVLRGDYLAAHQVMDRHYGVINQISHHGAEAISQSATQNLKQFGSEATVLGGHQFLDEFKDFSPFSLSILSDNVGTKKLAGGTYALPVNILGRLFVVLNPFHPFQLVPYYTATNAIVVMECTATQPWSELRQSLAGATDPAKAAEGSMRNQFLGRKEELGLAEVSQGANGIHLSAGPLEGMVEIQRFFTDHDAGTERALSDTCFGRLLAAKGLTPETVAQLSANPDLMVDGKSVSAFDLTEEVDAEPAAVALVETAPILAS